MNFNEIKEIISKACEKYGVKEYEVTYSIGENISAETLKDEISAFSSGESAQVYFRCIVDGHMGYASTSYFDADEIEDLVVRASDNARAIENDDVVVIFKGSESYGKTTAPEPEVVAAATLKEKAMELQKKAYAVNDAVVDGTQSIAISFRDEKFILRNILILSSLSYIFLSFIQESAELNSHSIVFLISSTQVVYWPIYVDSQLVLMLFFPHF